MPKSVTEGCTFHHVSLNVRDFDKAVAFYKALGMDVYVEFSIDDGGRHCFIDVGDGPYVELHTSTEAELADSRLQHICFHVDDVDATYARALANGARPKMPPFDYKLRCTTITIDARICHVYAPDGTGIEFIRWKDYEPRRYRALLKKSGAGRGAAVGGRKE
jgi:catechol 2,3-dioxygenase-like lactoylglutathione lyase family enzyme